MQDIIYDVAVSIDGYISGPNGDISQFASEGPVVEEYQTRLSNYSTAIMGKDTYEFGYRFGLEPGINPYDHLTSLVFSRSIELPSDSEVAVCRTSSAEDFMQLKRNATGPIYLCGGGAFAGSLLSMGMIDVIRLKRAPIILGSGVQLFGNIDYSPKLKHLDTRHYGDGYEYQEYQVLQQH